MVDCSIVIATYNKQRELRNTLRSICVQRPKCSFEVIVIDDGSKDKTAEVCENFRSYGYLIRYHKIEGRLDYVNPSVPRNVGYKMARGDVIIAQSDDVMHRELKTIDMLMEFQENQFNIAFVRNVSVDDYGTITKEFELYTSPTYPRPLFFLGSLYRKDIYEIGGNCEEFTEPGYEDDWFGQCLVHGLGLRPRFRIDVGGWHQKHVRPPVVKSYVKMKELFERKYAEASADKAEWVGGPAWEYK